MKKMHNEGVTNKLEAWLAFLCIDDPEDIVKLITVYPEFKSLYEDAYQLCLNMEKVMGMFSKELRMLDENTTQFMIDTMQEKLEKLQGYIAEQAEKNSELQDMVDEQAEKNSELQDTVDEQADLIQKLQAKLKEAGIEE